MHTWVTVIHLFGRVYFLVSYLAFFRVEWCEAYQIWEDIDIGYDRKSRTIFTCLLLQNLGDVRAKHLSDFFCLTMGLKLWYTFDGDR